MKSWLTVEWMIEERKTEVLNIMSFIKQPQLNERNVND